MHKGDYYCNNCKKWVSSRKNIYCPTCFTSFIDKYNDHTRKLRLFYGDSNEFVSFKNQVFVKCSESTYRLLRYGDIITFIDSSNESEYTEWEKNATARFVQFSQGVFTIKISKNGEVMQLDVIHDRDVRELDDGECFTQYDGTCYFCICKKENPPEPEQEIKKLPKNIVCFDLKNCVDLPDDANRIYFATLEKTNNGTGEREYAIYNEDEISDEEGIIWQPACGRSERVLYFLTKDYIKGDFGEARKAKQIKVPIITPKTEEVMVIKNTERVVPLAHEAWPPYTITNVTKIIYTPTIIKGDGMFIPDKI